MSQLSAVRIRLPLIQGSRDGLTNKLSGKPPALPRGNGVNIECAIFVADPRETSLVTDLANLSAVSMQCRKTSALGDALFDKTIPIANFDNTGLTWSQWSDDSSQHFTFELGATETAQNLEGKDELKIYLAFEAIPLVGDPFFLGSVTTSIFEDGIGSSGAPVVGDPTYLTEAQTDARYTKGAHVQFVVNTPASKTDLSVLPGGVAPATGLAFINIGATGIWTIRNPETEWKFSDRSSLA